ncbi:SCP2 sterol-binding domain-containing protein [Haliangium ochraceum]|uniref:Sterol-binding domain protein n=1 Tax=Haliangium ochraceum (strain DSM 14365 / JCM 11303 / SMP-2) TaxID=502025 RepID=D0LS95_HALO1|nr:SCP2 sterol-binding domain-containing protein [Haliangium ochraceum]ACY15594.1 Sterol-binding domain protein [Haliangium ochraceum DSM 14365]
MSLETTTQNIKGRVGDDAGIDATLKFNLQDDGVIFIDGRSKPNTVSNEDKDAECTITMELADLEAMLNGDLDPMSAFMGGKLSVDGDMGVAMKLQSLVS